MHLKSISVKGFKSFPDRTRLEFGPGTSVIVGPNGSGKSNITDAVLWALGEQSPLAVRGQTMQDVIFAGGHGLPSRNAAEVEVVLDNSDRGLDSDFSEISIVRRLDRTQDNLDRALDVEREARSRLRPLKRQAEAAELHERLERQSVEARFELARDDVRAVALELRIAEKAAADAAAERTETEKLL